MKSPKARPDILNSASELVNKSRLVQIHKSRSATLANRVVVVCVAAKDVKPVTPSMHKYREMLYVCLEEISSYFDAISQEPHLIGKMILKEGQDEITFVKWNEALQNVIVELFIESVSITEVFNPATDIADYDRDIAELEELLNSSAVFDNQTTRDTARSLLHSQKSERGQCSTKISPDSKVEIDPKLVRIEKEIGRGGFGVVYKARYRGDQVAVKSMPENQVNEKSLKALEIEANLMRRLSHPRIVAGYGFYKHDQSYWVIMEYLPNGSLSTYISTKTSCSWEKRIDFALDISQGMAFLHKMSIVHRDLKPGNIVLDAYDRAKITDFGLSVIKSNSTTSIAMSEAGTAAYMAPENFGLSPTYSTKSDVYAFSMILWELSHWSACYEGVLLAEIRDAIKNGDRLQIESSVPKQFSDLIVSCWNQNPRKRPTFIEITIFLDSISIANGFSNKSLLSKFTLMASGDYLFKNRNNDGLDPSKRSYLRRMKPLTWVCILVVFLIIGGGVTAALFLQSRSAEITVSPEVSTSSVNPSTSANPKSSTLSGLTAITEEIFASSKSPGPSSTSPMVQSSTANALQSTTAVLISSITAVATLNSTTIALSSQSANAQPQATTSLRSSPTSTSTNVVVAYTSNSVTPSSINNGLVASTTNPIVPTSNFVPTSSFLAQSTSTTTSKITTSYSAVQPTSTTTSRLTSTTSITTSRLVSTTSTTTSSTTTRPTSSTTTSSLAPSCTADSASNYFAYLYAGSMTTSAGSLNGNIKVALFRNPEGIAIDSNDNLFIADTGNFVIRFINASSGVVSPLAGSVGTSGVQTGLALTQARFTKPTRLCLQSDNSLIILDDSRIKKLDATRTSVSLLFTGGNGMRDIFCDKTAGTIWITDSNSNNLYTISATSGQVVKTYGASSTGLYLDGPIATAKFSYPNGTLTLTLGITKDAAGNVYIGDAGNNMIRVIRTNDRVETMAGTSEFGWTDGPNTTAVLGQVSTMIIDTQGNLLFTQNSPGCFSIRKISLSCPLYNVSSVIAGCLFEYKNGLGTQATANYFTQLAINSKGDIFSAGVNDNNIRRIQRISTILPVDPPASEIVTLPSGTCRPDSPSNYFVYDYSGSPIQAAGYTDGTLTQARYRNPNGLAIDSNDNFFIADSNNSVIRFINRSIGMVTTIAGSASIKNIVDGAALSTARFNYPTQLCLQSDSSLIILDNPYLRKLDSTRTTVSTLMSGGDLKSIYCDNDSGVIWVADGFSNSLYTISSTGSLVKTYGSAVDGFLDGPVSTARFSRPSGIVKDAYDNVYISDGYNSRIRVIRPNGIVETVAGTGTSGTVDNPGASANLGYPWTLIIDNQGNLIFVEHTVDCNTIRKVDLNCTDYVVNTVTSGCEYAYNTGPASGAKFNAARQIAMDSFGDFYVADELNHMIRRIQRL